MKKVLFLLLVITPLFVWAQQPSNVQTLPYGTVTVGCTGDSVTITLVNTKPSFTYIWNTGSTNQNLKVKTAGSYVVTVTDANTGSSAALPAVVINFKPQVLATIHLPGGTAGTCSGNAILMQAQPSGAAAYAWSYSGSSTILATTDTLSATNTGDYSVTVTSANGCTSVAHQHIDIYPLPTASITIDPANAMTCEGGSGITLTANALVNATYHWSNGATTQAITITNPGTATYTFTITDANGCSNVAAPKKITIFPKPQIAITPAGNTAICHGSSIVLQATAGFLSYTWSPTGQIATDHITVTAAGTYNVLVKDANGCVNYSNTITIVENPLPVAVITAGTPTICKGDSTLLTASGGSSYTWSNGKTSASVYAGTSGNYICTVTDANGCTATAAQPVLVQDSAVHITSNTLDNTACANSNALQLSVVNGSYNSYQWQLNGTDITGAVNANYQPLVSGAYTVKAFNACPSTLISNVIQVTIIATPTVSLEIINETNAITICEGDSVVLIARNGVTPGSKLVKYLWYLNGSNIDVTSDSVYTVKMGGSYQVRAKNECGISGLSNPVTVEVLHYNTPTFDTTAIHNNPLCPGGIDRILLTASPNGNVQWQWLKDGQPLAGETAQSISITTAGVYSLMETNQCTGIKFSDLKYHVRTSNTPSVELSFSNPNYKDTLCAGDAVTITAHLGGDYESIRWYFNGNVITNATGNTIVAEATGTYTVKVSHRCGPDVGVSQLLTFKAVPVISISSSNGYDVCGGSNTVLKAEDADLDGNNYLWSNGANTQSITVTEAGIYRVTVTSNTGCKAIASSGNVVFSDSLQVDFYETPSPESGRKIIFTDKSSAAAIHYEWSFGDGAESAEKNPVHTYAEEGTYIVKLTISDGKCSNTRYRKIIVREDVKVFPPAITPNGDGINDVFKVSRNAELVSVMKGEIFDRWGKKIADMQNGQWDGRAANGEDVNNSVYFYVTKLKFPDGTEHIEKGTVQVFR